MNFTTSTISLFLFSLGKQTTYTTYLVPPSIYMLLFMGLPATSKYYQNYKKVVVKSQANRGAKTTYLLIMGEYYGVYSS